MDSFIQPQRHLYLNGLIQMNESIEKFTKIPTGGEYEKNSQSLHLEENIKFGETTYTSLNG